MMLTYAVPWLFFYIHSFMIMMMVIVVIVIFVYYTPCKKRPKA